MCQVLTSFESAAQKSLRYHIQPCQTLNKIEMTVHMELILHTTTHTHTCIPKCSNMGMFTYKSCGMLARGMMVWWQTTLRWDWAKWKKMQCQRLMSSRPEQAVPLFLPFSSWLKTHKSYVMHTCIFKLYMYFSPSCTHLCSDSLSLAGRVTADFQRICWSDAVDVLGHHIRGDARRGCQLNGLIWRHLGKVPCHGIFCFWWIYK